MTSEWNDVKTSKPPMRRFLSGSSWTEKPYVLVVDALGRMSIAYASENGGNWIQWTMAKPIGNVTHWMPLPEPPKPTPQTKGEI
jgi:hypothetical protein